MKNKKINFLIKKIEKNIPSLIIKNLDELTVKEFEKYLSHQFTDYKISNPGSNRKLEWMTNISLDIAKSIILKSYDEFK